MEEIAHDQLENGGVPVRRGAATLKDISHLDGNKYGTDDSGRTIVPRTTLAGGVEGSANPFGHDIQVRIVDQDEDGMHVIGKKVVTGLGEEVVPAAPPAPPAAIKEDKPLADNKIAKKKKDGTTGTVQELTGKIADLEKLIAQRPAVVPAPAASARAPVLVSLSGAFGSMTMPYYDVIEAGGCIVLISEISTTVPTYTPPEQIPIEVGIGNKKTKVMHLGLEFHYEGKRLLVLIIDS